MTRTEEIKKRNLSRADLAKINAMAREEEKYSDNSGASTTLKGIPSGDTATGNAAVKVGSIEDLTKHYFAAFGDTAYAATLTVAAMHLEGAAMIAKAIRETRK